MPNKRHDATTPQDLLYDAETPAPSHAERARTLVAACRHGTLCTLTREPAGYPYGSVVSLAVHDGAPLFLISALAEHTKNLTVDRRCSLLVAESTSPQAPRTSSGDILALGRVTILGQGRRVLQRQRQRRARFTSRRIRRPAVTSTSRTLPCGRSTWRACAISAVLGGCLGCREANGNKRFPTHFVMRRQRSLPT